jgi:hypothetical protein
VCKLKQTIDVVTDNVPYSVGEAVKRARVKLGKQVDTGRYDTSALRQLNAHA